jgi:hypothetical protein
MAPAFRGARLKKDSCRQRRVGFTDDASGIPSRDGGPDRWQRRSRHSIAPLLRADAGQKGDWADGIHQGAQEHRVLAFPILHNAGGGWGERRLPWSDVFAVDLTMAVRYTAKERAQRS